MLFLLQLNYFRLFRFPLHSLRNELYATKTEMLSLICVQSLFIGSCIVYCPQMALKLEPEAFLSNPPPTGTNNPATSKARWVLTFG